MAEPKKGDVVLVRTSLSGFNGLYTIVGVLEKLVENKEVHLSKIFWSSCEIWEEYYPEEIPFDIENNWLCKSVEVLNMDKDSLTEEQCVLIERVRSMRDDLQENI